MRYQWELYSIKFISYQFANSWAYYPRIEPHRIQLGIKFDLSWPQRNPVNHESEQTAAFVFRWSVSFCLCLLNVKIVNVKIELHLCGNSRRVRFIGSLDKTFAWWPEKVDVVHSIYQKESLPCSNLWRPRLICISMCSQNPTSYKYLPFIYFFFFANLR